MSNAMNMDLLFANWGIALDYRIILRGFMERRISNNPSYSLRAFARDMRVSPSRISEILNYKQGLSRKAADVMAERLKLEESQRELFLDMVTACHARSPKARANAKQRLLKIRLNNTTDPLASETGDEVKVYSGGGAIDLASGYASI